MKRPLLTAFLVALVLTTPALAVDHNNIDAGRPLSFDDAESIAFRERSWEGGLGLSFPRGSAAGLGGDLELLYGFALNSHLSLGVDPSVGGRAGTGDTRADIGDLSVGVFRNFNREHGNTPAFAVRGDLALPTGRGSDGVELRLRGIMSKSVRQYDRLHVNVDLHLAPDAGDGERSFSPGVVLGYSRPLGYPRRFDRTGVAELAVQYGPESGTGPVVTLGLGLRQQVTVRSVLDLGVRSDVAASDGAARDRLQLIVGYSTSY